MAEGNVPQGAAPNGDARGTKRAHVLSAERIAGTRWLELHSISYEDSKGKQRKWDMATRATRQEAKDAVDAVAILALLKAPGAETETLLVRQFRPPVNAMTLELPAGLVDAGETPSQAALRELKEETGYTGTIQDCSSSIALSPGLTNESIQVVTVSVDLTAPENSNPQQALEDTEDIDVRRVKLSELMQTLKNAQAEGLVPFAGLHTLALGFDLARGAAA